jgi:hydrogenase expression/formation protein HypE
MNPEKILLAHGGGGRLMHELLERIFLPAFDNPALAERHDGARLDLAAAGIDPRALGAAVAGAQLAFTTDAYVVRPLFFPGGDIGRLAIHGTVNDLAMCGARPLWLSAAFILEEGLAVETLERVVASMRAAAAGVGVTLVTGDTKVVDRGKGDGLYVTTAGIGVISSRPGIVGTADAAPAIGPGAVRPGDAVILSGDVGRHGIAILAAREELALESMVESDCADLSKPVLALLDAGLEIHCLRDCTRGGCATNLIEIAQQTHVDLEIEEARVPVVPAVQGACELLGLDPLYVANEGRFVCFVPEAQAERAIEVLRGHAVSAGAVRVGRARETGRGTGAGRVTLRGALGVARVLDMLSGEQLPRIC